MRFLFVFCILIFSALPAYAGGFLRDFIENFFRPVYGEYVSDFEEKMSLRLFLNYNNSIFWETDLGSKALHSNNPLNLGIGVGVYNFYWDVLYQTPFTIDETVSSSSVFNFSFDLFVKMFWGNAGYYRERGYYAQDVETFEEFDYNSATFSGVIYWVPNYEKFSFQAIYFLDKKQLKSAGSFVMGARGEYSQMGVHSFAFGGFDIGYAYTFVKGHFFLSLWANANASVGEEYEFDRIMPYVKFTPQAVLGYYGKAISWNIVFKEVYAPFFFEEHTDHMNKGSFAFMTVIRM